MPIEDLLKSLLVQLKILENKIQVTHDDTNDFITQSLSKELDSVKKKNAEHPTDQSKSDLELVVCISSILRFRRKWIKIAEIS